MGARGPETLEELARPARLIDRFPEGPPANVGRAYQQMAEAIRAGQAFSPAFAHAESVHRLLHLIEQSSAEGTTIPVP